jgi:hypothetical protein
LGGGSERSSSVLGETTELIVVVAVAVVTVIIFSCRLVEFCQSLAMTRNEWTKIFLSVFTRHHALVGVRLGVRSVYLVLFSLVGPISLANFKRTTA